MGPRSAQPTVTGGADSSTTRSPILLTVVTMDAFILGAGFSIAVSNRAMPDTDTLGEIALSRQRSIHASQRKTHSDICDGISCNAPMLVNGTWPAPSFEVWLSRLAESQPYLYEPDNYERRAVYERLVGLIAMEIDGTAGWVMRSDPPSWLLVLVERWIADETPVVTLNYDTFVESTVEAVVCNRHKDPTAKAWSLSIGPRLIPLNPMLVTPVGNPLMPTAPGYDATKMSLYKLHGSTRWYWDDQTRSTDSMIDIGQGSGWYLHRSADADNREVPGKLPVIVPPTTTKSGFFSNGIIRAIWRGAYEALRRADRVFVLGYSLPPADLVVQSLLTEAFSVKHPKLWLVNTSDRTAENYKDLGVELDTTFCVKDQPIPHFVKQYVDNTL